MKNLLSTLSLSLVCIIFAYQALAQKTPNRMAVQIDGNLFNVEPRKIAVNQSVWITGNKVSPDKTLRIGIGNWGSPGAYTPGKYLVCDPHREIPQAEQAKLVSDNFIG